VPSSGCAGAPIAFMDARVMGKKKAKRARKASRRESARSAAMPMSLARVAMKLADLPGLVAMFAGLRRVGGRWTREPVLSLHLRRKAPPDLVEPGQLVPSVIDGVTTDVLGVGRPRLCFDVDSFDGLEVTYQSSPNGPRKSALSALARNPDGGMLALGSGHGLLPIISNGFDTGSWEVSDDLRVAVTEPGAPQGFLVEGSLGRNFDYGLVALPGLTPPDGVEGHHLARGKIPWTRTLPRNGGLVQHVSPRRAALITGHVVGDGVVGTDVTLGDAPWAVTHSNLLAVASGSAFARRADSGSLVFDHACRAIGVLVGVADDESVAYVLTDLPRLKQRMGGGTFRLFFEREPS
jgi:hypothetical protein